MSRLAFLFAVCVAGALAAPLTVDSTEAMTAGVDEVTAMAKDADFVYSLTDTTIIKASVENLNDFGVDDLATHPSGPFDSLTTIAVDSNDLYVTAKYQGSEVDSNSNVSLQGRYFVIKFDKVSMQLKTKVLIPEADNIPYAMVEVGESLYLGMYSFPGRVVRVTKSVSGSDLMQIDDTLVLDVGDDDVRSLEVDATDSNHLYANCNTLPGVVVRINTAGASMYVSSKVTFPIGIGHVLAGTGTNKLLASANAGDKMIYVATNQQPARVVKISAWNMQVVDTITLDVGENDAATMVQDAEFLYIGLWTSPAKIVRVSKKTLKRMDAVDLTHDRAAVLVTEKVGLNLFVFAGTFSTPASLVKLSGSVAPQNCVLSDWGTWSACPVTCGEGYQHRSRSVTQDARHGGVTCASLGPLTGGQQCHGDGNQPCPINCADGLVHTEQPYVQPLTCDNKNSHNTAVSTTPGCQCPPNKPYLHSLGKGGGTMCVTALRCDNNYEPCPSGSTSCIWMQLNTGNAGGRIRVVHGKCNGAVADEDSCSKHTETTLGGSGYQYHCRHSPGRLGNCQCLCYMPIEEHCSTPPALAHGGFTLVNKGSHHIGAEVRYTCDTGYILSGSSTRVCLSNTEWSGFPAVCEVSHSQN